MTVHDYMGTLSQPEREMLVGATLDITLEQLHNGLTGDKGDLVVEGAEHQGIDQIIATMIYSLANPDEPTSGQLFLQQIGLLSDTSMHWIVSTFGECPLHG